jgi:hypothetical protein
MKRIVLALGVLALLTGAVQLAAPTASAEPPLLFAPIDPDVPGGVVVVNVTTTPNAVCSIDMIPDPRSPAVNKPTGLVTKPADARGMVMWVFDIPSNAHPGWSTLKVDCGVPFRGEAQHVVSGPLPQR